MDAMKFIEERKRLCTMHDNCQECEARRDDDSCVFSATGDVTSADQIEFLEKWSAEHPRKTRQSVLLEQYPEAIRDREDILSVCPQYLDRNIKCGSGADCDDCRREFWMQEVE